MYVSVHYICMYVRMHVCIYSHMYAVRIYIYIYDPEARVRFPAVPEKK
jgi:hypothetical protein